MTGPYHTSDDAPVLDHVLIGERVRRGDHDILIAIANLLEENLAELKHIRHALEQNNERSSFEIDSNAKAGEPKFKPKSYAEDVETARQESHLAYVREMAALELAHMNGWQATLEALQNGGEAAD